MLITTYIRNDVEIIHIDCLAKLLSFSLLNRLLLPLGLLWLVFENELSMGAMTLSKRTMLLPKRAMCCLQGYIYSKESYVLPTSLC